IRHLIGYLLDFRPTYLYKQSFLQLPSQLLLPYCETCEQPVFRIAYLFQYDGLEFRRPYSCTNLCCKAFNPYASYLSTV
ncbi:11808_t:CDS:1, partial [Gigaspora rosea]